MILWRIALYLNDILCYDISLDNIPKFLIYHINTLHMKIPSYKFSVFFIFNKTISKDIIILMLFTQKTVYIQANSPDRIPRFWWYMFYWFILRCTREIICIIALYHLQRTIKQYLCIYSCFSHFYIYDV
jgi:hypothetical protein